jgi:hypothetical protein
VGYAIGFDPEWNRDVGHSVPAWCDYPGCRALIDRGLAYVCGGQPFGGDEGCGLYFCRRHLLWPWRRAQMCVRCEERMPPFEPTPDHPTWVAHKLADPSWEPWRADNPDRVAAMREALQ